MQKGKHGCIVSFIAGSIEAMRAVGWVFYACILKRKRKKAMYYETDVMYCALGLFLELGQAHYE